MNFVGESDHQAFIWLPEAAYGLSAGFNILDALDNSDCDSATDINDAGQVVGSSLLGDYTTHAFRWNAGSGVEDLGNLDGQDDIVPYAINNDGDVVGYTLGTPWYRAFLYDDSEETLWDLNDLISPSSGWVLCWAKDINDAGQIVGWGEFETSRRLFLLTPNTNPEIVSAVSRKTHGARGDYDIELALAGATVEPRLYGPTKIIVTFSELMYASDGTPDVTVSSGTVTSILLENHLVLTVELSGVTDQSCFSMTIADVHNLAGNELAEDTIRIVALEGDVTGDGSVSSQDTSAIQAHLSPFWNPADFIYDINLSGGVTSADTLMAGQRIGHSASCP